MHRVEMLRTKIASAKKLVFTDAEIVSRARKDAPYLTFLRHVTLIIVEVLLHYEIPIPLMTIIFREHMRKASPSSGKGTYAAK